MTTSVSVCVSVCLSVCKVSPEPRARSLPNLLCMLPMAVARSSSGVVAISYVLPVLWHHVFYNGPYSGMNCSTKDHFRFNLLIYHKVGQHSVSLLKGIIWTNYFEITRKLK